MDFIRQAGRILNSGQARSLVLSGNIHDLFYLEDDDGPGDYVPLVPFLTSKWNLDSWMLLVYELNGPIRFLRSEDRELMKEAWLTWRTGLDSNEIAVKRMISNAKARAELDAMDTAFESNLNAAVGKPTLALELLRQMCICSRTESDGEPLLRKNLIIIVESADMIIPMGTITSLSDADRHRVSICQDWFSDPGFVNGRDSVIMLAESRSMLNERIARLPQILEVPISAPTSDERKNFVQWFNKQQPTGKEVKFWSTLDDTATFSAGLTIHALSQLLKGARHEERDLTMKDMIDKVEEHIQSQLGEDIVEFKKPSHTLDNVIGFTNLKQFLKDELIPRFRSTGKDALPGAAVCGPIGGGKTFIFEAVASELDMVVLVLKNIRSQWFGQTDVIFERLRRTLDALSKVLIFIDEADTQMGGVGPNTHATERRLTGKIQAMMSDPRLRGRVNWLLMTARIHLLSPDIRRPGRVGDLIIPIMDPTGDDREAFLRWIVEPVLESDITDEQMKLLGNVTPGYSAASFASMRSELMAHALDGPLPFDKVLETIHDHIPPAIADTRRYQTLQALVNCTRRSLLPDPEIDEAGRAKWSEEIRDLEAMGIS
jgi:SpoVK/Ycf46/Vps4 family AAA+-type ATPase